MDYRFNLRRLFNSHGLIEIVVFLLVLFLLFLLHLVGFLIDDLSFIDLAELVLFDLLVILK